MNNRVALMFAAALAAAAFSPAFATPLVDAPSALRSSPKLAAPLAALNRIIELDDKHSFPGWADADFAQRMKPFLTRDLISAILYGSEVASQRRLDIWDADLLTGSQMMIHAKIWRAAFETPPTSDAATILADLSTSADEAAPLDPRHATMRYSMEREDGSWKIDDFNFIPELSQLTAARREDAARFPSAKAFFSQPQRYVQPMGLPADVSPFAGTLPIKLGDYANSIAPCPRSGSPDPSVLSFRGDSLDDAATSRAIDGKSSAAAGTYWLQMTAKGPQGSQSLTWSLNASDPEHFSVVGADRNADWTGDYRYCGPSPTVKAAAKSPARVGVAASVLGPDLDLSRGLYMGERGLPFLHNNSWVYVFKNAGLIVYDKPNASIANAVHPGDVLFQGVIGNKVVSGEAFVFRRGCSPAPYAVTGPGFAGDPAAEITLHGAAAIRDRSSCAVVGSDPNGANATLAFFGEAGIGD